MSNWISSRDRLPDFNTRVLICYYPVDVNDADVRGLDIGYYLLGQGWNVGNKYNAYSGNNIVTHWIELPEIPEESFDFFKK